MDAARAIRKLIGGLLLAAGSLIALSCGLCTGYFGIVSLVALSGKDGYESFGFTGPFLLAGVVAVAVGVGLGWFGLRLLRGGAPRSPDQ